MNETAPAISGEQDFVEDIFGDKKTTAAAEPVTEGLPNFSKMKKGELVAFYEDKINNDYDGPYTIDELKKMKIAEVRLVLKQEFPDPDALDSTEVTGFDPSDKIHQTVAEVQNLANENQAVKYVQNLHEESQYNAFRMGGALSEMLAKGWMGEYDDFGSFVEAMFGFKLRKAQYLISIYDALVKCGVSWEDVKDVGWSKLAMIATSLTPGNYKEWFEKIEGCTFSTVQELVKQANGAQDDGVVEQGESTPIKNLNIKLHEDSYETVRLGLDKAKEQGNTEYDGPALEYVMLDFLAGPTKALTEQTEMNTETQLVKIMGSAVKKSDDPVDALQTVMNAITAVFGKPYPNLDFDVYLEGKDE